MENTKTSDVQTVFELGCYSNFELAKFYGIDVKTMRRWLLPFAEEIGERIGRFYNIRQVQIIISKLGTPIVKPSITRKSLG